MRHRIIISLYYHDDAQLRQTPHVPPQLAPPALTGAMGETAEGAKRKRSRPRPAAPGSSPQTNKSNTCEEFFSPSSSNQMKLSGRTGVEKHVGVDAFGRTPETLMSSSPGDTLISPGPPRVREVPPTPRPHDDPTDIDTQSLQNTLEELEKKWQRSNEDAATATAGTIRSNRRARSGTAAAAGKKVAVTQTVPQQQPQRPETPSTAPSTAIPGVIDVQVRRDDAVEDGSVGMRSPRRRRRKELSVFERLSQQTTASSRRKRVVAGTTSTTDHHHGTPRSTQSLVSPRGSRYRAAAAGRKSFDTACSLSTLSCADSVYDRLYRNEPRPRRKNPNRTPRSSASCAWTIGEGDFDDETDAFSAAQARVERRLTYTPNVPGRTKKQQRPASATKGGKNQQRPGDEVFNRLYQDGVRAQSNRARTEVGRLEHSHGNDDAESFHTSRSRPISPSKSVRQSKRMNTTLKSARTQTAANETSSSPIEVLEIPNKGIDWDISCIEENDSKTLSDEHDDKDDSDVDSGDGAYDDCLHDAKQLIDDSVELIDNFLITTNQLIEESITEMLEEAEVSAIVDQAENTTFVALEEEMSELTREQEEAGSSILIQKVCRGYLTRRTYKALKSRSASSIVPVLVESALHSKKPSSAREDLITKYYFRERSMLDSDANAIPLQRLWQGENECFSAPEAAIVIQSRWRGYRAQRKLKAQGDAATCIQRYWLHVGYRFRISIAREKQEQMEMEDAAVIIQSKWRAHRATHGFRASVRSIVMLQAWSRSMLVLRLRKQKTKAILSIQRIWRQAVAAKDAEAIRRASISIQAQWRAYQARRHYFAVRSSMIAVQSVARQVIERKRYQSILEAAVLVQSFVRSYSTRMRYRIIIFGVTCLQSAHRARKARRILEDTQQALAAAIIIQSWYRHQLSSIRGKKMSTAATTIQRFYRGLQCRRTFASSIRSVIIAQSFCRQVLASHSVKRQRQIQAAISIQSRFRGHRTRQNHHKTVSAISLLQASIRSFLVFRNLTRSRKAAIIIQRKWRDQTAQNVAQLQSKSCTLIQTACRTYCHRRNFLLNRSSVIMLQACARRRLAMDEFKVRKTKVMAITKLQAITKGIQLRRKMGKRRDAAVHIQRTWRGTSRHKEYQLFIWSVVCMQSAARVLLAKQRASERTNAASVIGSYARMYLASKHHARCQDNAIQLQRVWRGVQSRRLASHRIGAIIVIQASLRRHQDKKEYLRWLQRIIALQALVRGQLERALLNRKRDAASIIQRAWRNYCQVSHDRLVNVVVQLQSALRSHACRRQFTAKKRSSTTIQAIVRGNFARAERRRVLNSVLYIQSIFRRHLVKSRLSRQWLAATLFQSSYRSHRQRSNYLNIIRSTVSLQACFRGIQARNEIRKIDLAIRERRIQAQVEMQAEADGRAVLSADQSVSDELVTFGPCVRKLVDQLYASQTRAAALASPQSKVDPPIRDGVKEASCLVKGVEDEPNENSAVVEAATSIQGAFRSLRVRSAFLLAIRGTTLLQAAGRRFLASRQFAVLRRATISLQSAWRGYAVRKYSGFLDRTSTIVQSKWRGHRLQCQYLSMKRASAVIQSSWRSHHLRRLFLIQNKAAILIQRIWRLHQTKMILYAYTQASTKIQSVWRAVAQRRVFMSRRSSATLIQALTRGRTARRIGEMDHAATCLQRAWRGHYARARIEKLKKKEKRKEAMRRRKVEKETKMAIAIQSRWRCFVLRKAFLSSVRSAIVLQHWSRRIVIAALLERQVKSAELLQNLWRCHVARNTARAAIVQCHSSKIIQSQWRAYLASCKYRSERSSAILLQSVVRRYLTRKRRMEMHPHRSHLPMIDTDSRENKAAHKIQVYYLAWKTRKALEAVELAATTIQRAVRACLLYTSMSPQELSEWKQMDAAAVLIQKLVRKRLATERMQGSQTQQGESLVSNWDHGPFSWLFIR